MKTLILDLDETLIFSSEERPEDYSFEFQLDKRTYFTKTRPYLKEFLDYAHEHFNIIIWTSASQDYAEIVCKEILKDKKYILLSRQFSNNSTRFEADEYCENAKYSKLLKIQKYWGKTIPSSCSGMSRLSIKPLKRVLKAFNLDPASVICLDNDPYKFANSYANLWSIKEYEGSSNDIELQKYIEILKELKNLPDVRIDKIPYIQKYKL